MKSKIFMIPVLAFLLSCTSSTFAVFGIIQNALETAYCTTTAAVNGSFKTAASVFTPQGWFPGYNSCCSNHGYRN